MAADTRDAADRDKDQTKRVSKALKWWRSHLSLQEFLRNTHSWVTAYEYVLAWLIFLIASLYLMDKLSSGWRWVPIAFATYLIIETFFAQLLITLIDREEPGWSRKSLARSAILGLLNLVEVIVASAIVFLGVALRWPSQFDHLDSPLDAVATATGPFGAAVERPIANHFPAEILVHTSTAVLVTLVVLVLGTLVGEIASQTPPTNLPKAEPPRASE